ncbi:serine/arginine repetitive matrix protein 1-like [Portunus trituberculatus]|uniref:serine/arginine repetitive matrix protein 1-like n=1 Tax=Portunus trituberculatus TaxID=210409 RepID=UPI001E1CC425|nr:serine/arginine repetitive matrix protein 1-like [Portunus trituberculatus]
MIPPPPPLPPPPHVRASAEVVSSSSNTRTMSNKSVHTRDHRSSPVAGGGQGVGDDLRTCGRLWELHLLYQQRRSYDDNKRSSSPSGLLSCTDASLSLSGRDRCDVSTTSQPLVQPPLPPPPVSPRSPPRAWHPAPAPASADRGIATAESPYPCQPSATHSGSSTEREVSYRKSRPQRPLTWGPQSTPPVFSSAEHHAPPAATTSPPGQSKAPSSGRTVAEKQVCPSSSGAARPLSASFVGSYESHRLQAQGLAEWLFFARLDRGSKDLSELSTTMELKVAPQVNGSSETSEGQRVSHMVRQESDENISREEIVRSAKYPSAKLKSGRSASPPPPPPRPRTPLDERDPELVLGERRYLSYFQEPPYKQQRTRSTSREPKTPDLQQLEAQRRYYCHFLSPPRGSSLTREEVYKSTEPDEVQLAAQRRYMSYFNPGPPRPRSARSQEPPELDSAQIEAERRYLSYFNAAPPRPRRQSSPGSRSSVEPDPVQLEAERRYLSYFNSGPPRSRPLSRPTSVTSEPDSEQLEAERRYLRYFSSGPPRPKRRPDDETEKSVDKPDSQQLEAEKRYMAYFQGTPKAKHKKEVETDEENEGKLRVPPTREMLEAEERFLNYFKPIPCGAPKRLLDEPPPVSEHEKMRQQLLREFWEALENRIDRKEKKIIKVSRPKREIHREATPPTQRELVVEEFLQRVKDRKKEKDLHYGDTDDEEEEDQKDKTPGEEDEPAPVIEGGGEVKGKIVEDLGLFVSSEVSPRP